MKVKCNNCGALNDTSGGEATSPARCGKCGAFLPAPLPPSGSTSEAVGLIGGAALGAAIGGPIGAVVGAVVGALIGREAKGVG